MLIKDNLKRLYENKTLRRKALKRVNQLKTLLNLAGTVSTKIPTRDDTLLSTSIKLVGIGGDLLTEVLPDDGPYEALKLEYDITEEMRNQVLADLVETVQTFDSKQEQFYGSTTPTSEFNYRLWAIPGIGNLATLRYANNASPSPFIVYSKGFDFEELVARIWAHFEGHIQIETSAKWDGPPSYDGFKPVSHPLYGSDKEKMDEVLTEHQTFKLNRIPRCYMFHGPPGTGKTSFGLELAERVGGQILRISGEAVLRYNLSEIIGVLKILQPDFLVLDDIDKGSVTVARLLAFTSELKAHGISSILTANTITSFDTGVFRPGRVDTWVEFTVPDEISRRAILEAYLATKSLTVSADELALLVTTSEGLTQDYIREIADLVEYVGVPKTLKKIAIMCKILKVKAEAEVGEKKPTKKEEPSNDHAKAQLPSMT